MAHTIHDIGVASQIGAYSDSIEAAPNLRWMMTSGTPGLSTTGDLPTDITGQAELAWEHIIRMLDKARMTVSDIVKATHYLTRAEDIQAYASVRARFLVRLGQRRCCLLFLNSSGRNFWSRLKSSRQRPEASGSRPASAVNERLAFLQQFRKLPFLLGDAVGGQRFVSGARKSCGLLGQLPDVVADNGDPLVKLFE